MEHVGWNVIVIIIAGSLLCIVLELYFRRDWKRFQERQKEELVVKKIKEMFRRHKWD